MNYQSCKEDAPLWQIMVSIRRILLGMDFRSMGTGSRKIQPEGIVIRKRVGQDKSGSGAGEVKPGILITLPRQSSTPWSGGTNREVDTTDPILLQIIDDDLGTGPEPLRTVLYWQNMILRKFCSPNLDLVNLETPGVSFQLPHVTQAYNLDPKAWDLHHNYQAGLIVECIYRQTWGDVT